MAMATLSNTGRCGEAVRSGAELAGVDALVRVVFAALLVDFSTSGAYSQVRYHLGRRPADDAG